CGVAVRGRSSYQRLLFCPVGPGRERLARVPVRAVATDHALDVVGEIGGTHAQPADRPAQAALVAVGRGHAAAQVHLGAGGVAVEQLALETDVGGLDAGAAVGATVEVDGHRRLQRCVVGEPALQLVDQLGGRVLGVDKGELAVPDAGAGHGRAAEGAGAGVEPDGGESLDHRLDPVPL